MIPAALAALLSLPSVLPVRHNVPSTASTSKSLTAGTSVSTSPTPAVEAEVVEVEVSALPALVIHWWTDR